MCSLTITPAIPARSASTANPTRSATSGAGRIVQFSVRISKSRGPLTAAPGPAAAATHPAARPLRQPPRARSLVHPDWKRLEPVGEVRPDPPRLSRELKPAEPPGKRGEHDLHLKPGQVHPEA